MFFFWTRLKRCCVCLQYTVHVLTIYGIDAVANEIDVVLNFIYLGMKIQALISQKQNKVAII
jgi:hypothetical protein